MSSPLNTNIPPNWNTTVFGYEKNTTQSYWNSTEALNNSQPTTIDPYRNTTTPSSGYSENFIMPEWGKILLCIGYGYILTSGAIGNSVVLCTTLFIKRRRRKPSNQQIISLAFADLLGSIFVPIVMMHDVLTDLDWKLLGNFGCKLFPPMTVFSTVASSWMMVSIAIARFRVIRNPIRIQNTSDIYNVIGIVQAWLVAGLLTAPYMYYMEDRDGDCWDWWNTKLDKFIWTVMLFIAWLVVPMLILLAVYPLSYRYLRQSTFRESTNDSNRISKNRLKRNRRIARTFSTIIIVFFILTTPYAIFYFIWMYLAHYNAIYFETHLTKFLSCNYFLYFIASLNSTINPYIYAQTKLANRRRRRSSRKTKMIALPDSIYTKNVSVGTNNNGFLSSERGSTVKEITTRSVGDETKL